MDFNVDFSTLISVAEDKISTKIHSKGADFSMDFAFTH